MNKLIPYRHIKFQKDIYILENIAQCFLINENYKGLEFLSNNLEVTKTIPLLAETIIYSVYKRFDQEGIFLDCPNNETFFLVDIRASKTKSIAMLDKQRTFLPWLYSWKDDLILTSEDHNFYFLAPCKNLIARISKKEVAIRDSLFVKYYDIAQNYKIIRSYPEKYQFIFADYSKQIIGSYSVINNKMHTIPYKEWINPYGYGFGPKHFDAHYVYKTFVLISENSIEIRTKDKVAAITCDPSLSFIRAAPFIKDKKIHLTVLGYDKSHPAESFLQQYKIGELE